MARSVLSPVLLAPFPRHYSCFLFCFPHPSVIDKFDYVFAENGTVQYKNGQLVSKQVGPAPLQPRLRFPIPVQPLCPACGGEQRLAPGRWAASSHLPEN